MKHDELITKLKRIILPYIQDEKAFQELSMETDFIRDLKINSANLVDIVLDVEDEFNIKIENDDMEEMISVEGAMGIIRTRLKGK